MGAKMNLIIRNILFTLVEYVPSIFPINSLTVIAIISILAGINVSNRLIDIV